MPSSRPLKLDIGLNFGSQKFKNQFKIPKKLGYQNFLTLVNFDIKMYRIKFLVP